MWSSKHARYVNKWACKNASRVGEHGSTQGPLAREHVTRQGTLAREHVSKQGMHLSRLKIKTNKILQSLQNLERTNVKPEKEKRFICKPHQSSNFEFRKRCFRKMVTNCKREWFKKYPGLRYINVLVSVYCCSCVASNRNMISNHKIKNGFKEWKGFRRRSAVKLSPGSWRDKFHKRSFGQSRPIAILKV